MRDEGERSLEAAETVADEDLHIILKEFAEDTPWLHLDIAGTAWMEDNKPWIAKGPSGIAVRSLVEFARELGK